VKGKTINAKVVSVTDDNRPVVLYKGREHVVIMGASNTIDSNDLIGKVIMVLYMPLDDYVLRFPVFQGINEVLTNV